MYNTPPVIEFENRIKIFQNYLAENDISAALIFHKVNLYYLSGSMGPACFYIPCEGKPLYLTRQRGSSADIPWETANYKNWKELIKIIGDSDYKLTGKIGLEFDVLPTADYVSLNKIINSAEFIDIGKSIRLQRAIKSPWELDILRSTASRDQSVWEHIPEFIKRSKTDLELAALVEAKARSQGHIGVLRMHKFNLEMSLTCVLVDENGAVPSLYETPLSGIGTTSAFPFGACGAALQTGKPILIDYGGCYEGYIIDQSRTYGINKLPDEAFAAYDKTLEIQEELISFAKPGVACCEVYEKAKALADKSGIEGFMGACGGVPFVGHGIGLEIDEFPVIARGSKQILTEGMTIALEPKFVLPQLGAVGIENSFEITSSGLRRLSQVGDDLQIIEM